MENNQIKWEEFGRWFNKPREFACALLDGEAFKSWHTHLREANGVMC